jgi:hypothetical protein
VGFHFFFVKVWLFSDDVLRAARIAAIGVQCLMGVFRALEAARGLRIA